MYLLTALSFNVMEYRHSRHKYAVEYANERLELAVLPTVNESIVLLSLLAVELLIPMAGFPIGVSYDSVGQ